MGTSTPCWLILYSLWTLTLCHLSDPTKSPMQTPTPETEPQEGASLPWYWRPLPDFLEVSTTFVVGPLLADWTGSVSNADPAPTSASHQIWPSVLPFLYSTHVLPAGQPPELLLYLALCLGQPIDQFLCLASWSGQPPELSSFSPYSDALYLCFVLFLLRYPPPLRVKWVFWILV